MVYHLALIAGLKVTERHSHSVDIYEEDQRYTPLGADATVVWGFKDLRLHNPYPFAVSLGLAVRDGALHGEVNAAEAMTARMVEFMRVPLKMPLVQVKTVINGEIEAVTVYEQKQGLKAVG